MLEERSLTPREMEVLRYVAEGYKTKEIADRLKISTKTVETHRTHINDKMGFQSIAHLVRYAIEEGIIEIRKKG